MRKKYLDNNMKNRCNIDCNRNNFQFRNKRKDTIKFYKKKKENQEKCMYSK